VRSAIAECLRQICFSASPSTDLCGRWFIANPKKQGRQAYGPGSSSSGPHLIN
jgi:hypothetical protein